MENEWIEIRIDIPTEWMDPVSGFLFGMGAEGVVTGGGTVDTFELKEELQERTEIKAYFPPADAPDKVAEIRSYLEGLGITFNMSHSGVKDADWANNWKEFFKPEKVSERIVIKPTWESFEAKGNEIVIEIDPGMAFGTGTHPTTRGCIRMIEEVVSQGPVETMLDVGTGSGILAIAAAKLGVARTIGIDLDGEAVRVAEENIKLNHVEEMVRVAKIKVDIIQVVFHIVVANIIAEEIVRLSKALKNRVAPGGRLILSGIVSDKAEMVRDTFRDLTLERESVEGEWVTMRYRK